MKFSGWHPCSLIDFPGKVCAVLFTEGCTFRCPFCHNPELVLPDHFTKTPILEQEIFSFLEKRGNKLDGITITGGEPTIHADLESFIRKVKALGFAVKLDTNGTNPAVLETLLHKALVDFVAMDIKSSLATYNALAGVSVNTSCIETSIQLLINSKISYEFRTTVIKELHPMNVVVDMAKMIHGAKRYVLQKFRPEKTLDKSFQHYSSYTDEEMRELCNIAKPFVQECLYR